jgi:hypothetical protein
MDAEDFFSRWSRRAAEVKAAQAQENAGEEKNANTEEGAPAILTEQRPVTLEDVASLTKDSDYKPFMAKGIDEAVKRSAMKKLFSDPHFNVMDGLDIYIDDYSVFEPISPATLLAMNHAKPLLDPLKQIQSSMLSLLQESEDPTENDAIKNAIERQSGTEHAAEQAAIDQETTQEQRQQAGAKTEKGQEKDGISDAPARKQSATDISNPTKPAEQ